MINVVFFGTPHAAVPTLLKVAESHRIGLVITQPDRPRGRSGRPQPSAVKTAARELGLQVSQPDSAARLGEALAEVGSIDVGVVVAYGRILRPAVLNAASTGYLNVHFSLLPRWRGAAPVERAIMAGDTMTGVTIIELDEGMDTGPVLTAQAIDIGRSETGGALTSRLADLGASLLASSIPGYVSGDLKPVVQTDEGANHAAKISKTDRPLDARMNVVDAINKIRALAPIPGATLSVDGEQFKILAAAKTDLDLQSGTWTSEGGRLVVGLGDGAIELTLIQPPGRSPQGGPEWLRGARRDRGIVE